MSLRGTTPVYLPFTKQALSGTGINKTVSLYPIALTGEPRRSLMYQRHKSVRGSETMFKMRYPRPFSAAGLSVEACHFYSSLQCYFHVLEIVLFIIAEKKGLSTRFFYFSNSASEMGTWD